MSTEDLSNAVRRVLAVDLYRKGRVSLGKAVEIAGVSLWEMLEILAREGVPVRYGPEDLEGDLEALKGKSGNRAHKLKTFCRDSSRRPQ